MSTMNHAAAGSRRRVRCVLGGKMDGVMIMANECLFKSTQSIFKIQESKTTTHGIHETHT